MPIQTTKTLSKLSIFIKKVSVRVVTSKEIIKYFHRVPVKSVSVGKSLPVFSWDASSETFFSELIVYCPLVGVTEDIVGLCQQLELLVCLRGLDFVGVVYQGPLSVGLFHIFNCGTSVYL